MIKSHVRRKMKKHLICSLIISPFLLFGIYWLSVYSSLKNPMDEMMYSETSRVNMMFYPSLGEAIGREKILDNRYFLGSDDFQGTQYSDELIKSEEWLEVTVFRNTNLLFMYHFELEEGIYVGLTFKYNSDNYLFSQESLYLHKDNIEYKNTDLVNHLATYGKDLNWLRTQSKKVVEDYILGIWFENGSSRYSLDNLGNLRIKYDELLKE